MTPEQNKNYILNNLDKFIIDKRGNFVNLEKDYKDNNYIIWKSSVEDYKEVKEKFIKEITKDKKRWSGIHNEKIIEAMMEEILSDKENWEIVYVPKPTGGNEPTKYRYLPTGEEISARMYEIFNFDQVYILNGELGWKEHIWRDYDKWGHYRLKEWWRKRNYKKQQKSNPTQNIPQTESAQLQNQTPTPETNQPNLTPPPKDETTNHQNPLPQPNQTTTQEVKDNLNQVQNGTKEQKDQAAQNPTEYSQDAVNKITKKMQEEGISEADLNQDDNQTKTLFTSLKNGQIKDPTEIVAAENQIRQKVWQTKVEKEIQTLTQEVNQLLQTSKRGKKPDITKLKQKLVEFLAKSNVYYSAQHQKAQELLTKLENYSNTSQQNNNPSSSPSSVPWKIIIPLFLMVIMLLSIGAIVWKTKKLSRRRKTKKIINDR